MNQQKYLFLGGVNHRKHRFVRDGEQRIVAYKFKKIPFSMSGVSDSAIEPQEYEKIKICDGGYGNNVIYVFKYTKNSNDTALRQYLNYVNYKKIRKYRKNQPSMYKYINNLNKQALAALSIPKHLLYDNENTNYSRLANN